MQTKKIIIVSISIIVVLSAIIFQLLLNKNDNTRIIKSNNTASVNAEINNIEDQVRNIDKKIASETSSRMSYDSSPSVTINNNVNRRESTGILGDILNEPLQQAPPIQRSPLLTDGANTQIVQLKSEREMLMEKLKVLYQLQATTR